MRITFLVGTSEKILDFILVDYENVIEKNIYDQGLARITLKNPKCFIDANSFRNLLKFYMGGNGTLKEYLDHIEKHGFYTPYQPNLNIVVTRFSV